MVTVFVLKKIIRTGNYLLLTGHRICYHLCICQIEASICPPPPGHLTPLPSWGGGNLPLPSRGGGNLIIRVFQGLGNLIPML